MDKEVKCPHCHSGTSSPCQVCGILWDYKDNKLDTMENQIDQIAIENRDLDIRLTKLEKEDKK